MLKTLKTFYYFVFRKKLLFCVIMLLVILASILTSITPYFFKLFVEAIPTLNYQWLLQILFIYLGVNILALAFDVTGIWFGDRILFDAARDARVEIFKKVQDLDFAFHSSKSTGSLISAFKRGDSAFFTLYHIIHFRFLDVFVSTAVMLYFFANINLAIAALIIASFSVTVFITKFLVARNVNKRTIFNKEEDNISGIIVDNMINYETVKLFSKEKWEQDRLSKAFIPWRNALWGYGNTFRAIDIGIGSITTLSIFLILFVSIRSAANLTLSIGDFVLITGFIGAFFPKLWNLVWNARDIAKNYADIEKYFGLLDFGIDIKDPVEPIKMESVDGEILFKNVSFSYGERKSNAIHNFTLKIRQGQSVALVGRSGSGKTTLVKLLMRFYDLSKGKIMIDGTNIKDFNKSDLRSFIGVVPQEPILFNNTILYNIGYGLPAQAGKGPATKKEIIAAAKLANIDEFIESLPKKYETLVGERGVKLSGGQKQRLAIARMILSTPSIIIFDEATSQLDSESEKLIQEAFWKAIKDKTTIIIAHRLSTIMRADKIVVMEEGKIKEAGSHKELLSKPDSLYSHFWNLQIKLD